MEDYRVAGLGHGTPLKTAGDDGCGVAGPHMLEAGISSTWQQALSWGLVSGTPKRRKTVSPEAGATAPRADGVAAGVSATIEQALRSAGLMR